MGPTLARTARAMVVVVAAVALTLTAAGATTAPGTPAQVAKLVAAARTIEQLPANVTPSLANAPNDSALTEYPDLNACMAYHVLTCAFGDPHGTHTMVLFGDSHALMWFPALQRIAVAEKWRGLAIMMLGCPAADVTIWNIVTHAAANNCVPWRTQAIAKINKVHPSLVIVSERFYTLDATDKPITYPEWTTGLETSLASLQAKGTNVVLIGQSAVIPKTPMCLAAYPTSIQRCSLPEGLPWFLQQIAADRAAAKARSVRYINEVPWTCSSTCTTVIGNMIVYYSAGHLTATYDAYLTNVMKLALAPAMQLQPKAKVAHTPPS